MRQQFFPGSDAQQDMEQSTVPDIDLWSLHLTLVEILVPGLKLPYDRNR